MSASNQNKYIAALDVGTTTVRCHIINSEARTLGQASTNLKVLYPKPGFVEIDPDVLWNDVVYVIKTAISNANLVAADVSCLGIGTQRGTFLTWRKDNDKPFHNFVAWNCMRSKKLVKEWNNSSTMKIFRSSAYLLYLCTGNKRYYLGSKMKTTTAQVTLRLKWLLENIPELKEEINKNNVKFGTVDTWLVHKFTNGAKFVSDYCNASATGLFDPFVLSWANWAKSLFGLPIHILPPIVTNDHELGKTEKSIFGVEIPINCLIADQQASMFGSCFSPETLKITLGTGTFLNLQTGYPIGGDGIYPLVQYSLAGSTLFMTEGACSDCGTLIKWALQLGLCEKPLETSKLASSLPSNDGVYFIPAFSGLGPPINDDKAGSGFIGIKPTTERAHLVRAILESIVFRVKLQLDVLKEQAEGINIKRICVDGGVSQNDFLCQMLADLTNLEVERPESTEVSSLGVAFVTGLNFGIWDKKEDLIPLRRVDKVFTPTKDPSVIEGYRYQLQFWLKAVDRFKSWNN